MSKLTRRLLCRGHITKDWFGESCPENHFKLSISNETLHFEAQVHQPPPNDFPAQPGEFFEGLWKSDVSELFISDDNGTRYLEINLAPNGAWWIMAFSAPRQRLKNFQIDQQRVETTSKLSANQWKSTLSIPHGLLQNILRTDNIRFNVTYILGNPKHYLSYCNLHSVQPDFHIPKNYQRLIVPKKTPDT